MKKSWQRDLIGRNRTIVSQSHARGCHNVFFIAAQRATMRITFACPSCLGFVGLLGVALEAGFQSTMVQSYLHYACSKVTILYIICPRTGFQALWFNATLTTQSLFSSGLDSLKPLERRRGSTKKLRQCNGLLTGTPLAFAVREEKSYVRPGCFSLLLYVFLPLLFRGIKKLFRHDSSFSWFPIMPAA